MAKPTLLQNFLLLCVCSVADVPAVVAAESWTPAILDSKEFLPDYSYAGYYWGEQNLPALTPTLEVTAFGAVPDDGKDDTAAIRAAIRAAQKTPGIAVLHFPAGRFVVSDVIYVQRSDFVLQGEGSGPASTVFEISRPLKDMDVPWSTKWLKAYYVLFGKRAQNGLLFSTFSWTGGVFWVRSPDRDYSNELDVKVLDGERGQHRVQVVNSAPVRPGDVLSIQWFNHDAERDSLLKHIYGAYDLNMGSRLYGWFWNPILTQPVTVERVEDNLLVLKEPLLHDLKPEWTPKLVRPTYLEHVGMENFRIEFPPTQYAGHHLEDGYNGIYFTGVMHSWIRNVSIENADSAIIADRCKNITLDGIAVNGRAGHYTVMTADCYGALVKNFEFQADSVHNPSFNTKSRLNAYSGGVINNAKLDQHRGINHQNLFDNIQIHTADDIFAHGGAPYWGPTAGRYNTFWNIRIDNAPKDGFIGHCTEAPEARLIGIVGIHSELSLEYSPAPYIEGLNKQDIAVPSLYQWQLEKRLRGKN